MTIRILALAVALFFPAGLGGWLADLFYTTTHATSGRVPGDYKR